MKEVGDFAETLKSAPRRDCCESPQFPNCYGLKLLALLQAFGKITSDVRATVARVARGLRAAETGSWSPRAGSSERRWSLE